MTCAVDDFNEGDDGAIELKFTDEFGNAVVPTTVHYWLYDEKTKDILNSRTNVELTSPAATMYLLLTPDDNVIHSDPDRVEEIHVVMVKFVYTSSLGVGRTRHKEHRFIIKNLAKVS